MNEKFGERLRAAREQKQLSQSELAEKSGFQASAISHFENGRREPSFDNLKKLADALEVSIDHLLGRAIASKSAGPLAEQVFRDFGKMSAADQESIARMASILASKRK